MMLNLYSKSTKIHMGRRGLCSFFVKNYPSYVGRNPKTGKKIAVKAKKLPFFKVGKGLKELLNEADTKNQSTNVATRPIDP